MCCRIKDYHSMNIIKIRTILLSFLLIISSVNVFAQTKDQKEQLDKTMQFHELVDNGKKVRYTYKFEDLGKSKEELLECLPNFIKLTDWAKISDFDVKKENDTFIVTFSAYYGNVGGRHSLGHDYNLFLSCNYRVDLKDNRVRILVDFTDYTQYHINKTGILQTEQKSVVPFAIVPPYQKLPKEKDNRMFADSFIKVHNLTFEMFSCIYQSFSMLVKKDPDASTDW